MPVGDLVVSELEALPGLDSWEHITPREREVLVLLADGLSSPEIAASLGIARSTARTHLEHLRARLGAATQAGLVAKALRLGLLV
jgi:DNA-binding CsgD family transcriptional regulator